MKGVKSPKNVQAKRDATRMPTTVGTKTGMKRVTAALVVWVGDAALDDDPEVPAG